MRTDPDIAHGVGHSNYGYCPVCYAPIRSRSRGIPPRDTCQQGHTYDSGLTLTKAQRDERSGRLNNSALKAIAGQLLNLSYTDMCKLADIWNATNANPEGVAGRFIRVAQKIQAGEGE